MNLLLIGSRYLPYRHEGDKNFWLELVSIIKREIDNVYVISLNNEYKTTYSKESNVSTYNISPVPFPSLRSKITETDIGLTTNYLSLTLSFIKIQSRIKEIIKKEEINIVHFMDNYGPIMILMKKLSTPSTIFAPTYHPQYPLYDTFLKLSLKPFDKVITTTNAFNHRLAELGIHEKRIETIRWGVDTLNIKRDKKTEIETKKKLNFNPESKIILWSGFSQLQSVKDFYYAIKIAKEVIKYTDEYKFVFAFKHVHFKNDYLKYGNTDIKIIKTKTNEEFLNLVNASTLFLSSFTAMESINSPPLTWIECMARGVPIATTNAKGVNELVVDGYTGYIFNDTKSGSERILNADENDMLDISKSARSYIQQNYNIHTIADAYVNMWRALDERI